MRQGFTDLPPQGVMSSSSSWKQNMEHTNHNSDVLRSRIHPSTLAIQSKKKRRIFYLLIALVLIFQGVIVPWLLAPRVYRNDPLLGVSYDASDSLTMMMMREGQPDRPADGTFNGYPIYLQEKSEASFHSTVHCVGETHNPETAWMYRSCEFTNLCLDTQSNEFFVVESPIQRELQQHRIPGTFFSTDLSSSSNNQTRNSRKSGGSSSSSNNNNNLNYNLTVALGGINPRWVGKDFNQGIEKVQWFPKHVVQAPSKYYVLSNRVTLVPFHSFAAHNVGHMLWDDFLPIYTLLHIFGWDHLIGGPAYDDAQKLLLLRVDTLPLLYGTCEMRRKKGKKCAENFEKFLPLLGVDPNTFSTVRTVTFRPNNDKAATWICARHAMAGLGMLTDHGLKDHGWLMPKETHSVHNTAKGALLYQFRNALLQNLGLPLVPPRDTPVRIVLSAHSSGDPPRDNHFINQENVLKRAFPDIPVQIVELAKLGLREQVELVSQTRIFVSTCGGGAMTATFLPKGATLILYYNEDGGYDFANDFNLTGDPAFLDWDLFNNMAYLRVHWLPIGSMNTQEGWKTLAYLIRHELEVMESGL